MDPLQSAPPAAEPCLSRPYSATGQKGGTVVRPEVGSREEHERWLDEGRYRPAVCPSPRCGSTRLHAHGWRSRYLLGELVPSEPSLGEVALIAVFRCADCDATWRVLPAFIARWLHRSWRVVREAVAPHAPPGHLAPQRTRQRWAARLLQAALAPVQLLALSLDAQLRSLAQQAGLEASREQLIAAYAARAPEHCPFSALAELLHRMHPGIRLL